MNTGSMARTALDGMRRGAQIRRPFHTANGCVHVWEGCLKLGRNIPIGPGPSKRAFVLRNPDATGEEGGKHHVWPAGERMMSAPRGL